MTMYAYFYGMQKWGYLMNEQLKLGLKKYFDSGKTHALKITCDHNKNIVSLDSTLCMYDYADAILRGVKYGNTRARK